MLHIYSVHYTVQSTADVSVPKHFHFTGTLIVGLMQKNRRKKRIEGVCAYD